MVKGVDERIDKSILQWFGHIERMGNIRSVKRVYMRECVGSCLVCLSQKRGLIL